MTGSLVEMSGRTVGMFGRVWLWGVIGRGGACLCGELGSGDGIGGIAKSGCSGE